MWEADGGCYVGVQAVINTWPSAAGHEDGHERESMCRKGAKLIDPPRHPGLSKGRLRHLLVNAGSFPPCHLSYLVRARTGESCIWSWRALDVRGTTLAW